MKIITKNYIVHKSYDDICTVIKKSAYRLTTPRFCGNEFTVRLPKRLINHRISTYTVKGKISKIHENKSDVQLSICANFEFYIGVLFTLLGMILLVWQLYHHDFDWMPILGLFSWGFAIIVRFLWISKTILARIENKFCSRTGDG